MFQVFYHKGCNDGYFAAAAVHFFNKGAPGTVYTPAYHDSMKSMTALAPLVTLDKNLKGFLFVDIAPSPELAVELVEAGYTVYVVDHHKSARDDMLKLKDLRPAIMDSPHFKVIIYNKMSGAALAYMLATKALEHGRTCIFDLLDYIPSKGLDTDEHMLTNMPAYGYLGASSFELENLNELYKLIAIRDLWITKDPDKKRIADQVNAWFYFNKIFNNEDFDLLPVELKSLIVSPGTSNKHLQTIVNEGWMIMEVFLKQTKDDVQHARLQRYSYKGKTLSVYIGSFVHVSLAGQMVRDLNPGEPTILIRVVTDFKQPLKLNLSFRSNDVVCRVIAEQLGGGGHDMASGAIVNLAKTDTVEYTVECLDKLIKNAIEKNLI